MADVNDYNSGSFSEKEYVDKGLADDKAEDL